MNTLDVLLLGLGVRLDVRVSLEQVVNGFADVGDLCFHHVDHRAGSKTSIWSEHDEEIREASHGCAGKGSTPVRPMIGEKMVVAADDPMRNRQVGGLEARSYHKQVKVDLPSGTSFDCSRSDSLDSVGIELNIRLTKGRVVIVGNEDALAADRVVRGQSLTQIGISDLGFEVRE